MNAKKRRFFRPLARLMSTNRSWQIVSLASLLTAIFLAVPGMTVAQFIRDVGGVAVTVHAKTGFNEVLSGNPLVDNEMRLTTYDVWLPLPRVKLGKGMMFGSINGRMLDFQYDEETSLSSHQLKKIYEIKPTLIAIVPVSKRLAILGVAIPMVASDFKEPLSGQDVILDGVVTLTRRFGRNQNLEIGVGAHVLHAFSKTMLTPAVSLDYKSQNGKVIAQFYWPRLNVFYNVNQRTQVGLAGSIDWTMHNLIDYEDAKGKQVDYGQFSSIHAGLQVNRTLFGRFIFQAQGGLAVLNSYKLYDTQNTEISQFQVSNMLYSKLMLTYRF